MSDNPNNPYRSYTTSKVYGGEGQSTVGSGVTHERLSMEEMIARANGGSPEDTSSVGKFVSDGK